MIDTHFHLNDSKFGLTDKKSIVDEAKSFGVKKAINICAEYDEAKDVIELSRIDDILFATVGVHPHYAQKVSKSLVLEHKKLITKNRDKVVAVGEIGLDYYYNDENSKEKQIKVFKWYLDLARKLNLPVVIHSRDAIEDTLEILSLYKDLTIVMHCFSYSKEVMERFLKIGCYISFSGIVTFKNATKIIEAARSCPIDRLLCETDSPWLSPEPFRGKINKPGYVKFVYERIESIRNSDIKDDVRNNVMKVFGI